MKRVFYFSIIFLFYTHRAFSSCDLESYEFIIKINKSLDSTLIKNTNCPDEVQNAFIDFISSASGELSSKHLAQIFHAENNFKINFKPLIIKVATIDETLMHLLRLGNESTINKLTSLYGQASIQLDSAAHLKAQCNNCETAGSKNIKLYVNENPIWFTGEVLHKRVGFIVASEINPFNDKLNSELFIKKVFFDNGESHLFKDIDQIQFYKTTKKLSKGSVLKTSDITPISLIKPGQKISVILNGKNISLKSSAYSRSSGKIGEFIEIYNTKTNKKVTAQVVDFNTVMVQL